MTEAKTQVAGRPSGPARRHLSVDDYVDGVRAGNRAILARAITLVESRNPEHQAQAQEILLRLLSHTGGAHRVGISGVPGVGKSTFIETMGTNLVDRGSKVAVLAVDPSSSRSGGSILGDKTRMANLAAHPNAFIRPSPSAGTLGGVTRTTRETMLVCEAAGFDVVLVETVGTGQSETMVADMVDFFLVLMLPGAGDELQGIKKGILEIADMIAVNKAEGDNKVKARLAKRQYESALHIMTPASPNWTPPVVTCSALANQGIDELWAKVEEHRHTLWETGELADRRRAQQVRWMWSMLEDRLMAALRTHPEVRRDLPGVEAAVSDGRLTAVLAAERLLRAFGI
ncbi:MAG: methylmalonyl Co-A mutase-associated GTPase MeaB [Rhodobacterales bacterium]|nr:methylmalonyl Co-A mutase-associated GTPase MeaB [Rhodobacterales bacterium]